MGKTSKSGAGGGMSGSEGTVISGKRVAVLVGVLGSAAAVYVYMRARNADPYRRYLRGSCLAVSPASEPRVATHLALRQVRSVYAKIPAGATASPVAGVSLGALVYFLRGDPDTVFDGNKVTNAYRFRLPLTYIQYIGDNYLPGTKAAAAESAQSKDAASPPSSSSSSLSLAVERGMFLELVELDFGFRCLEKLRGTAFNNNDRTHVNLLQQLWVAAGNPGTSFQRTTTQWTDLGFQGEDPATDLRGAGILGLRQLVHFAQTYPDVFQEMITFNKRTLAAKKDSWYLLAVVSLQMTAHLLLQKEVAFFPAHLEVLYDTLTPFASNSANQLRSTAPGAAGTGPAGAPGGISRRAAAQKLNLPTLADRRVWQSVLQIVAASGPKTTSTSGGAAATPTAAASGSTLCGDPEAGMNALHHQLLFHFKTCWERDEPHVMDYNTYTPQKVYDTFFCASWRPVEIVGKSAVARGSSPS